MNEEVKNILLGLADSYGKREHSAAGQVCEWYIAVANGRLKIEELKSKLVDLTTPTKMTVHLFYDQALVEVNALMERKPVHA